MSLLLEGAATPFEGEHLMMADAREPLPWVAARPDLHPSVVPEVIDDLDGGCRQVWVGGVAISPAAHSARPGTGEACAGTRPAQRAGPRELTGDHALTLTGASDTHDTALTRKRQNPRRYQGFCRVFCGRYRTRTDDLFRVKEARYQLRQSPAPAGYVNRYYPTSGPRDDHFPRHARDSFPVLTDSDHRLMFHKCPGRTNREQRGCSAVGSASPCQGEGREFESRHPLKCRGLLRKAFRTWGQSTRWRGRAARHRPAKPFTRVRIPSPPLLQLNSPYGRDWRSGSALP